MTCAVGSRVTVWSPDAREFVTGTVYYSRPGYLSLETETGRCVGGPTGWLRPQVAA